MLRTLPQLNYNISEKEIYLKFSEEPSKNINPTISYYLNKSKKNIDTYQSEWDNTKKYTNEYKSYYLIIEGFLALYFLVSIITTILFANRNFGFLPFHLFLFFGYTYIFVYSFRK